MKKYEFFLGEREVNEYFSPIRQKEDVIKLLMYAIKTMLLPPIDSSSAKGKMLLLVSKTSRLYFFTDSKYFSIAFPIFVKEENGGTLRFSSHYIEDVDSKITSDILGLMTCEKALASECVLDFLEPLWESPEDFHRYLWTFLKELLLFEDAYIRYDYDIEHENGRIHPLHHLDVFYSSGTFKIGLENYIDDDFFINIMNLETDCLYLR